MKTQFKFQFNFDITNEENTSSTDQKEIIPPLGKPKNLLKSMSLTLDDQYFAENLSEREENNYLFSHHDFSDAFNKRLDECSDDDYSSLKKEIDSYIKANDEDSDSDYVSKNKINQDLITAKKTFVKIDSKKKPEDKGDKNSLEEENLLKNDFSIWQKKRESSKNLTLPKLDDFSDKTKLFIPKKHRLEIHQKEKLKDISIDTNTIKESVLRKNLSNSTCDLSGEEKVFVYNNSDKNSKSLLELQKNNFSNSPFSTAYNSLCTTPISSPETDVKKTLKRNSDISILSNNSGSNKNLYECYFEDSSNYGFGSSGINDSFKICHINSFCTKSENDSKINSPQNYFLDNNFISSAGNKTVINSKLNSVNNNSSSNLNNDYKSSNSNNKVYPLNPNVYYDTTNITNNSIIKNNNNNYNPSSIYNSPHNFCQIPIYQNQLYFNNFNISTSAPSYTPKKTKYSNDPLNVLREQTNSMIRTTNGKAVPFEEPHNRINLENILRGKDKRTTLMIRHIPNKYTLQTILEDINVEFKDKYDLFYLPLDFNNNCNLGFAFINFVDSFHILGFYDYFRGKRWRRFNSEKICELAYAKFQGKKELINHFEKGSVMNFDSEDKKPLILPTPNPVPKICLPMKFFDAFLLIYPYSNFEIFEEEKKFVINSFYEF